MVITLVGSDIAAVELCCRPCIVLYYSLKPNTCIIIKKCQHYVECTIKAKRKECQSKCLTLKMEKKALFSFLCSTYCFSIHEYINNIYSEKKILSKKKISSGISGPKSALLHDQNALSMFHKENTGNLIRKLLTDKTLIQTRVVLSQG